MPVLIPTPVPPFPTAQRGGEAAARAFCGGPREGEAAAAAPSGSPAGGGQLNPRAGQPLLREPLVFASIPALVHPSPVIPSAPHGCVSVPFGFKWGENQPFRPLGFAGRSSRWFGCSPPVTRSLLPLPRTSLYFSGGFVMMLLKDQE